MKDVRQTRLVSSMLCGYAPEFFSYFDVKCALTSTYNTSTKRTMSLAEQLECGQITFEVWSKFIDEYEKVNEFTLIYNSLFLNHILNFDFFKEHNRNSARYMRGSIGRSAGESNRHSRLAAHTTSEQQQHIASILASGRTKCAFVSGQHRSGHPILQNRRLFENNQLGA